MVVKFTSVLKLTDINYTNDLISSIIIERKIQNYRTSLLTFNFGYRSLLARDIYELLDKKKIAIEINHLH